MIFLECAKLYGLDADLLCSICVEETRGNFNVTNKKSGAHGLMQIMPDVWANQTVSYYKLNEASGQFELHSLHITPKMLKDPVWSVHIGSIILQTCLISKNYNIPLAIQSYNQGTGATTKILKKYCRAYNKDYESVINNPSDIGWIEYAHKQENAYAIRINKWSDKHTFTVINVKTNEPVSFRYINEKPKKLILAKK